MKTKITVTIEAPKSVLDALEKRLKQPMHKPYSFVPKYTWRS